MSKDDVVNNIGKAIGGFTGEKEPDTQKTGQRKLSEMILEIHQNAIDHGWYDKFDKTNEDDSQDKLNLIISEIQECTECVRNGEMELTFRDDGKPEGFPSEIADVVIRIMDYMGACGHTFNDYQIECTHWDTKELFPVQISSALFNMSQHVADYDLVGSLRCCKYLSCRLGFDLDEVVSIKHKYNKKRTYKHGGKLV